MASEPRNITLERVNRLTRNVLRAEINALQHLIKNLLNDRKERDALRDEVYALKRVARVRQAASNVEAG